MSLRHGLVRSVVTATIDISTDDDLSGAVNLNGLTLAAIVMPSAWTAADLTFQGSVDGSRFLDIKDSSGTEVSVTVAADEYLQIDPASWRGVQRLKIRSGTSATPVAQAADRDIQLVLVD